MWNKQSPNQVKETLNSLPKQNQNCLNITKIAPLKQSRFTFLNMRKQQGRLGSYNKQYTLYKVSGTPKCVLVWIWKKGPHLAGAGKQVNEVCSKQKLSLKTTQQQAIVSMSPSQSKSSTVTGKAKTSGVGRGRWGGIQQRKEGTAVGGKVAGSRWRVSNLQLCCIRHNPKCQAPALKTALQSSLSQALSSFRFFSSCDTFLPLWFTKGGFQGEHYTR